MGALVLHLLGLGLRPALEAGIEPTAALPGRWDLSLHGEGKLRPMAVGADIDGELALTWYDVLVTLEAARAEVRTSQCSICHLDPSKTLLLACTHRIPTLTDA